MTKPHVLQITSYPQWDQTSLEAAYTMHTLQGITDRASFLAMVGPQIEAIATRGDLGADASMINACPNLKMIAIYGVGFDAVDLDLCRARGIKVSNTPDVLTDDVADLGVGMMLAKSRGIVGADAWVRTGSWATKGSYPLQNRVWGRKAGILGLGRIGFAIARRLVGFGMDIAYSSVSPKPHATGLTFIADPVELARHSDFLFVALAASAATRHIVNRAVIDAVGPDGMIINISRAANIDETALLDALEDGRLGQAALDVFEGEPALNPRFLALNNVLLQPHQGSGTTQTRQAMGAMMRENLAAHFAGTALPNPVIA